MDEITENLLKQNYPNPTGSGTTIPYHLFTPGFVVIKVFDSMGQIISTLVTEQQETGFYEVDFDASELNTGVYYYTMAIDNEFVNTKRMVVMK